MAVKLSNFTEIYSLTNGKKYGINNPTQKYLLHKQFVAWSCNICSATPDYINNPVYQELINENDYNGVQSDERVYLDLRASAGYTSEEEKLERNDSKINLSTERKNSTTEKLRLRVSAYSLRKYLYVLSRQGLTLRHKATYGTWVVKEDEGKEEECFLSEP